MTTVLIGAYGQLGSALRACFDGELIALGHSDVDITDQASVESALSQAEPQCVINTVMFEAESPAALVRPMEPMFTGRVVVPGL